MGSFDTRLRQSVTVGRTTESAPSRSRFCCIAEDFEDGAAVGIGDGLEKLAAETGGGSEALQVRADSVELFARSNVVHPDRAGIQEHGHQLFALVGIGRIVR